MLLFGHYSHTAVIFHMCVAGCLVAGWTETRESPICLALDLRTGARQRSSVLVHHIIYDQYWIFKADINMFNI